MKKMDNIVDSKTNEDKLPEIEANLANVEEFLDSKINEDKLPEVEANLANLEEYLSSNNIVVVTQTTISTADVQASTSRTKRRRSFPMRSILKREAKRKARILIRNITKGELRRRKRLRRPRGRRRPNFRRRSASRKRLHRNDSLSGCCRQCGDF